MKPSLPEGPAPYPHAVARVYTAIRLIQALLGGVKTVYRRTLRALQGFTQSLRDLAFQSLPVPITPRSVAGQKGLMSNCRSFSTSNRSIWMSTDAGLKVYGEGEWEVRQRGYAKRRTWRKVHLALNANTGQVQAALTTNQNVADGDTLAKLLDQIPRATNRSMSSVATVPTTPKPCQGAIAARSAVPSIPPRTRVAAHSLASGYARCGVA
ncbi:MAG: hypothetical protein E5299_00136 [Burkholderia gladioli]|nr:MAG: hypothetical protein E5299_00136 [Burkholderia gladioli]